MEYSKVNWKDFPDTSTKLNAENLNKMDQGIMDAKEAIDQLKKTADELNSNLANKQNLLEAGRYTGNIDAVGTSGIRENSICWINSTNASGNQPIKGYYMLKTFLDGIGNVSQKAICYTGESPLIKERIYCNGSWSDWTLPPASLNDLIPYAKASDVEANYAQKTDLIPYAKIQELNNGLNVRQKLFYNDTNKSLLGITNDTTINQVVDGMMLPKYSELTLWINDDTVIGRTVRNNINETHKVKPFGYLTIKRFDQVIKLYFEDYGSTDIYLNSYTSINSQGWSADWVKK